MPPGTQNAELTRRSRNLPPTPENANLTHFAVAPTNTIIPTDTGNLVRDSRLVLKKIQSPTDTGGMTPRNYSEYIAWMA